MNRILAWMCGVIALSLTVSQGFTGEPVKRGENWADEPRIEKFSLDKAVAFLDAAALDWTRRRECFTCHTNVAFLYARPMISAKTATHDEIRTALETMVEKRWPAKKPRWDAEVVVAAAALAFNDAATTGTLHPATRVALDRMWTIQRDDGGWSWLLCDWPPMENDDHYGVTLAALAVGVAPEGYAKTPAAIAGIKKIKSYLAANPPKNAHHQAMILWADTSLPGLVAPAQADEWIKNLRQLQRPDGGWSASGLYPWPRGDGKPQAPELSDGYGAGFAIHVLRVRGVPASDPAVQKGIDWLKANQRASGRWHTRSLFRDGKHYISHAGTAFAIMALKSCEGAATK